MKKILVTGATGFIGNYVIKELLDHGYEVIASSSQKDRAATASWFHRVKYIPLDLKELDDRVNYFSYFTEPDALIHLAWEGLPNYKESFHLEENFPRHFSFLQNLLTHGLIDLTVTGTCLEYGMQEGCLKEEMPAKPSNQYAIAKDALRISLEELQKNSPYHLKWVRLFYMYGDGQGLNSLFSQLDKALDNGEKIFNMSGGEQVRDFLHVEKMAEYIVTIALQHKVTGIINCCSGRPLTVNELVAEHLKKKGKDILLNKGFYPYSDYEPMNFWGNNAKLKSITDNDQMSTDG